MGGVPVYLASLSRRSPITGEPKPTGRWSPAEIAQGTATLRQVLAGVGDPGRERLFRMNLTLCLHRAIDRAEAAALPDAFHAAPAVALAGGPVAVLWESEPGSASTQPCVAPRRVRLGYRDPDLWLPVDCGACPSCRARAAIEDGAG